MAKEKMEKLQTGILHKQTVPAQEHKGCAFHSKPSCIHFKVSGHSAWIVERNLLELYPNVLIKNLLQPLIDLQWILAFFSNNLFVKW